MSLMALNLSDIGFLCYQQNTPQHIETLISHKVICGYDIVSLKETKYCTKSFLNLPRKMHFFYFKAEVTRVATNYLPEIYEL